MSRAHSLLDRTVLSLDRALKTLSPGTVRANRPNPADKAESPALEEDEQKHIAGLMRINHTGEVCAQALYQGQALTARLGSVKNAMEDAAEEEVDHLAWCEDRLRELGSHTSVLNPAFYAMSFSIGALAGLAGDKWSLGFVAATEEQVCKHLRAHLDDLPEDDDKSRRILETMLEDEAAHATNALSAGGVDFSPSVKEAMTLVSKIMTSTTYRV